MTQEMARVRWWEADVQVSGNLQGALQLCSRCPDGADCSLGGSSVIPGKGFWALQTVNTARRGSNDNATVTAPSMRLYTCRPGFCLGNNTCREGQQGFNLLLLNPSAALCLPFHVLGLNLLLHSYALSLNVMLGRVSMCAMQLWVRSIITRLHLLQSESLSVAQSGSTSGFYNHLCSGVPGMVDQPVGATAQNGGCLRAAQGLAYLLFPTGLEDRVYAGSKAFHSYLRTSAAAMETLLQYS